MTRPNTAVCKHSELEQRTDKCHYVNTTSAPFRVDIACSTVEEQHFHCGMDQGLQQAAIRLPVSQEGEEKVTKPCLQRQLPVTR